MGASKILDVSAGAGQPAKRLISMHRIRGPARSCLKTHFVFRSALLLIGGQMQECDAKILAVGDFQALPVATPA
jgi:hypothetical protein